MGDYSKDDYSAIVDIIIRETVYFRTYKGQVSDVNDPVRKDRMKVVVPALGFQGKNVGFWCSPCEKQQAIHLKKADWTYVFFEDGNPDRPRYFGKANDMKNMLPNNSNGSPLEDILYEDIENKIHIKFNGNDNVLEIGDQAFKEAARKDDTTIINGSTDSAFITWISQVSAAINILAPGSIAPIPTTVAGKIDSGSSQIKIGDK